MLLLKRVEDNGTFGLVLSMNDDVQVGLVWFSFVMSNDDTFVELRQLQQLQELHAL